MPELSTLLNRLTRRPYWAAALALSVACLLATQVWQGRMAERAKRAAQTVVELESRLRGAKPEGAAAKMPDADFVSTLPASASIEPIVRDLQRASAALNVAFLSLDATAKDAAASTLGRTELMLTLRGEYPKLKAVVAQVLDRYPNLVLKHLSMRKVLAPTDLEASVNLLLLSQPLPATSSRN